MMAVCDALSARWLRLLAGAALLAALAGCATGTDDPDRQLSRIQSLAEKGDASAQTELGIFYFNRVPPDYDSAAIWFLKSARQGFPEAQWHLGMLYLNGQGVQKNEKLAAYWFGLAAEQGWQPGQTNLNLLGTGPSPQIDRRQLTWAMRAAETSEGQVGMSLVTGLGTPQDYRYAYMWLRDAAGRGDMEAQYRLGQFYAKGTGTRTDNIEAHKWYNLAAAQGHILAARARDKLSRRMTLADIYEAQRRAANVVITNWVASPPR